MIQTTFLQQTPNLSQFEAGYWRIMTTRRTMTEGMNPLCDCGEEFVNALVDLKPPWGWTGSNKRIEASSNICRGLIYFRKRDFSPHSEHMCGPNGLVFDSAFGTDSVSLSRSSAKSSGSESASASTTDMLGLRILDPRQRSIRLQQPSHREQFHWEYRLLESSTVPWTSYLQPAVAPAARSNHTRLTRCP